MSETGRGERRRSWVRLDNAANIFLAARSEVDTKVFRISAELDEEIDPKVLQAALDRTYAQYPLYRAVLRQGIFWYYLQQSNLHPTVQPEDGPPVQHLYHQDRHDLLFRVLYRGRRISVETFHALTDGAGALWFFQDLVTEYVGFRHPAKFGVGAKSGIKQEFAVDAFTDWFRKGRGDFAEDAVPAVYAPTTELPEDLEEPAQPRPKRHRHKDVLSIKGEYTPDNRARVVELAVPVHQVLPLARAEGVSLTIYLLAVYFDALYSTRMGAGRARTLTASVPINLRQFFPTESGRNFFATTVLAHTYTNDPGTDSIGAVCRSLDRQFAAVLTKESLERKVRRLVAFEKNAALRFVPRPVKDVILGTINRSANRRLTVAMSNLGRFNFPEPVTQHVGRCYLHVSAVRPQFCMASHGDELTISFTSPFVETDYLATFVRRLTAEGVEVAINANRVSEYELAEVEG